MININALDTVIAVVVVILLLSLIVQSIQSVLKKALKIKSRQIEDSLIDLFENVLQYTPPVAATPQNRGQTAAAWMKRVTGSSPLLRVVYAWTFRRPHPASPIEHSDPSVRALFSQVIVGFQQVGRVAQTGNRMLDSISKEDLKKVMGKVLPDTLLGGFSERLRMACANIDRLDETIQTINTQYLSNLRGDANAKFAAMQQSLAPLLNDLRSVRKGQGPSATLIIEDIVNLRGVKLGDALNILGEIQQRVSTDLTEANKSQAGGTPPDAGAIDNLTGLSKALGGITEELTSLSIALDAAITPLRTKLNEVETWYDTVMQSFEERYARGMKTWAIIISFLVVAYLNANIFDIYRTIATNDVLRTQLVQIGEVRNNANEQRLAAARIQKDTQQVKQTVEEIRKDTDEIKKQIADYSSFGFQPLTWQEVKDRFNPARWSSDGWFDRRKDDLKTLFGWIVMTFLLSVGAPFWQDALESLFGVKNLLRKKSDTKNVEADSGAGQPKP